MKERLEVATSPCPSSQAEGSEDRGTTQPTPHPHHHHPISLLRFCAPRAAPRLTSKRNVWMGLPSWS